MKIKAIHVFACKTDLPGIRTRKTPADAEISKFSKRIDFEMSLRFIEILPSRKYLNRSPVPRKASEKTEKNRIGKSWVVFIDFSSNVNFSCKYHDKIKKGMPRKGKSRMIFSSMLSEPGTLFRISLLMIVPQMP